MAEYGPVSLPWQTGAFSTWCLRMHNYTFQSLRLVLKVKSSRDQILGFNNIKAIQDLVRFYHRERNEVLHRSFYCLMDDNSQTELRHSDYSISLIQMKNITNKWLKYWTDSFSSHNIFLLLFVLGIQRQTHGEIPNHWVILQISAIDRTEWGQDVA